MKNTAPLLPALMVEAGDGGGCGRSDGHGGDEGDILAAMVGDFGSKQGSGWAWKLVVREGACLLMVTCMFMHSATGY